jgi:hypothetical protein
MNERLPYEEMMDQQWNDLPIPDQEQSWEKMKHLLDEDDDRRRIIPPVFLPGCGGWALILLAVLIGFWYFVHPERWFSQKNKTAQQKEKRTADSSGRTEVNAISIDTIITLPGDKKEALAIHQKNQRLPGTNETGDSTGSASVQQRSNNNHIATSAKGGIRTENGQGKQVTSGSVQKPKKEHQPAKKDIRVTQGETGQGKINRDTVKKQEQAVLENGTKKIDALVSTGDSVMAKPVTHQTDSTKKDSAKTETHPAEKAKTEEKKKKFYVSAGIGLQQQIPMNGQKATPYNIYGRKGSLADYIPSVYLRLHRPEKWFLDGGFRYGAPQAVKEVNYSTTAITVFDTSGQQTIRTTTTTTSRLKKTFYHQVPFSFNYQLMPHWSVGTGLLYSRFHGAVSEVEVHKTRNQVDSLVSKKLVQVPPTSDSFFTRSQIHLLFQTEYEWRRMGIGLRYTRGLQPFLKYTDAAGVLKQEKNTSLQLFLRFRVWNSKIPANKK